MGGMRISKIGLSIIVGALVLAGCAKKDETPVTTTGGGDTNQQQQPATVLTQSIWKNGTAGVWGGNAITGAITVNISGDGNFILATDNSITDNLISGSPSLKVYCSTLSGGSQTQVQAWLQNSADITLWNKGNLHFDIRLGDGGSNISALSAQAIGNKVNLSVSSLSSSVFTHVSIPNTTTSTSISGGVPNLFLMLFTYTPVAVNGVFPSKVLFYLNNIYWTSN